MNRYYIAPNGKPTGPFTVDELMARGLNDNTLVYTDSMDDWLPASQVNELYDAMHPKEAAPEESLLKGNPAAKLKDPKNLARAAATIATIGGVIEASKEPLATQTESQPAQEEPAADSTQQAAAQPQPAHEENAAPETSDETVVAVAAATIADQPQPAQPAQQPQQPQQPQPAQQPQPQQPQQPQQAAPQPAQQQYQYGPQPVQQQVAPPVTNKGQAIAAIVLSVIMCCNIVSLIFAIIGLSKGSSATSAYNRRDYDTAEYEAASARQWTLYALIALVAVPVLMTIYFCLTDPEFREIFQ